LWANEEGRLKLPSDVIVTIADRNYIDQAKQLFSSIYFNSGWTGDYLLLAHELPDQETRWFRDRGIIVRHVKALRRSGFHWLPGTVLGKLYLLDEWMRKWDRVLYIDSDTTVEADLDPILKMKGILASPDFHERRLKGQFHELSRFGKDKDLKEALGKLKRSYDVNSVSFNSGVMFFEKDALPDDPFGSSLDLYREYEPIVLHDQSILNLLFYGKWKPLPLVFNNYFLYKRAPWSMRFEKCGGAVNHYVLDKVWKTRNGDYYPRWKELLDRADEMDLSRRLPAKWKLTDREIDDISGRLSVSTPFRDMLSNRFHDSVKMVDRSIGRVGRAIKKTSPGLYRSLRR